VQNAQPFRIGVSGASMQQSAMRNVFRTCLLALAVTACAAPPRPSSSASAPAASRQSEVSVPSLPQGRSRPGVLYERAPWEVVTRTSSIAGVGRTCSAIAWGPDDQTALMVLVRQSGGQTGFSASFLNDAWDVPRATEQRATARFDGRALSVPVVGENNQISLVMVLWPDRGHEFLRHLANADNTALVLRSGATMSVDTTGARAALVALGECEAAQFGTRLVARAIAEGVRNPMAP
jgi:hypothetical protein